MQRSIALFDLDGVILDTEGSYTAFWDDYGSRHFSEKDFGLKIKGQTLVKILGDYFPEENERKAITDAINDFQTPEKVVARYRGQLNLYSLALESIKHKKVTHRYLYLVTSGQVVEI